MSDALSSAAAALGIPEALVKRSAEARSAETGMSVDEVLTAWAGGGLIAAAKPVGPPAESSADTTEEAAMEEEATPAPAVAPIPEAAAVTATASPRKSAPAEVTPAEAAHLPEVVTVPTAGIREKTNFRMPGWLVAVLMIIPAFALFSMGGSATGKCGTDTELATDIITGEIVNCDGSTFTGSGVAGGSTDYVALGEAIYLGTGATGVNCSGCHGVDGGGGGAFPPLTGVANTFASCADHEEWVKLGTLGFQAEGRGTYGDNQKPVGGGGVMPSHSGLSDEQLASVVAYERVRFGGVDLETTLTDCGLADVAGPPTDGETTEPPPDGETAPSSTVPAAGVS